MYTNIAYLFKDVFEVLVFISFVIYVKIKLKCLCLHRSIGIPKKIKHSVVNVCISTLMLMVVFMFGINRRDMEVLCQIVGIFIHYLTLCVIFWITVCTKYVDDSNSLLCFIFVFTNKQTFVCCCNFW